jgi:hypothetical protein
VSHISIRGVECLFTRMSLALCENCSSNAIYLRKIRPALQWEVFRRGWLTVEGKCLVHPQNGDGEFSAIVHPDCIGRNK